MNKRELIVSALGLAAFVPTSFSQAAEDGFDALLARLDADPSIVEDAWQYRDHSITRGVGTGTPSKRRISPRAIDMIVRLEIASPKRYDQLYSRPIWPKGKSGVTIGIGYDLRFANTYFLQRDWGGLLSPQQLATLRTVVRLQGDAAHAALASVHSINIPFEAANKQFLAFLPYPTAQTEGVFPNTGSLGDDSFGALVSLVYNRGPDIRKDSDSRREMREVHDLMAAQDFSAVPARIRAMKRLWTAPNTRGLVIRRELEAQLFEMGLSHT